MFKTVSYVDVATIRQILNEPENCKYANQPIAFENEILRRFNDASGVKDPCVVISSMIANGELRINPDFVALQQNHLDHDCLMDAVTKALGEHCRNAGLPINSFTLERAFQQIEGSFIPHSQKWYDDQIRKQNQIDAERLRGELFETYKKSFEYRLVGQHWVRTSEKLLAHTASLYEKERTHLAGLTLDQLRAEATAKTEATARAEAESEEKQRLTELPREELVKIANQGRQVSSQFAVLPPNYSPPGEPEVQIPWSVQLLKRLPPSETKRLIRVYSANAINAAIATKGK
jgi:hypothetical protein